MKQNPYEVLKKMFKEQYKRDRNLFEFTYKQSDSFITWIIGFAVAGLTLIASKMDSTDVTFKDIKNTLIILLGASILFGVAFRYFFYSVMVYHNRKGRKKGSSAMVDLFAF